VPGHRPEQDLVAFAERVLALLDQGSFVATYKYAVLLALMDLCLEKTNKHGAAPDMVTTRELAEKVVELYWPQTSEFRGRTLRQNAGRQARILTDIAAVRAARSRAPRGVQVVRATGGQGRVDAHPDAASPPAGGRR
jgi:hypothetical protein